MAVFVDSVLEAVHILNNFHLLRVASVSLLLSTLCCMLYAVYMCAYYTFNRTVAAL